MAAEHKAPTQVTVVQAEKSAMAAWIERNWKYAALVAIGVTALVVGTEVARSRSRAADHAVWQRLSAAFAEPTPEAREPLLAELQGSAAEPWGLLTQVYAYLEERDYAAARTTLERLRDTQNTELTQDLYPLGTEGAQKTLADRLEELIAQQETWERDHPGLFENPPLPEDAPRVRLRTTEGDIVVGLYEAEAPEHVRNFLKLVDEGAYVGTKFHRVMRGFMIQGGDPNTIEGDVATWGQGGPGYKVPHEDNDLHHFAGVLSAAKQGNDVESSGSQFFITTGAPHHLDGRHVVFGAVVEGMDIVHAIEEGEIEDAPTNRPRNPVEILEATRL